MNDDLTIICSSADLQGIVATHALPLTFADVAVAASELDGVLHQFLLAHKWEQVPPPSKSRDQLREIKSKAKKLALELAQFDPGFSDMDLKADAFRRLASAAEIVGAASGGYPGFPPVKTETGGIWYRGRDRLMSAIESVNLLVQWSDEAEKRVSPRVRATNKKNKGHAATNALLGDVFGFWVEHAKEAPKVWASDTGPCSPVIKLVLALRDLLREKLPREYFDEDIELSQTVSKLSAQSVKDRMDAIAKPLRVASRQ